MKKRIYLKEQKRLDIENIKKKIFKIFILTMAIDTLQRYNNQEYWNGLIAEATLTDITEEILEKKGITPDTFDNYYDLVEEIVSELKEKEIDVSIYDFIYDEIEKIKKQI